MELYQILYEHHKSSDIDVVIGVLDLICDCLDSKFGGEELSEWLSEQSYKLDELVSKQEKDPEYVAWLNLFRQKDD
jgi:hypothetical protein